MMKKIISVFLLTLLCLVGTFAFQRYNRLLEKSDDMNPSKTTLSVSGSCNAPKTINQGIVGSTSFSIDWIDLDATAWEYFVQIEGIGLPDATKSISTTTSNAFIDLDFKGIPLFPNTNYEVFIRSKCTDGTFSDWSTPLIVLTNCMPMTSFPIIENFSSTSITLNCWRIIDKNGKLSTSSTPWKINNNVVFNGRSAPNNDWLISFPITLNNTKIYAISYDVKTNNNINAEYEIVLSKNGIAPNEFKEVVAPKTSYTNTNFERRTHYLSNINGEIHLAWHVSSSGLTQFTIKDILIEEVDCLGVNPEKVKIQSITNNSVSINWADTNNNSWEIYLQPKGGTLPKVSGTKVTSSPFTTSNVNTGGTIQADTEYEFYIRSNCGSTKYSKWEGPFTFRTSCNTFAFPFFEGFNTTSTTVNCWRIVNANYGVDYDSKVTWEIRNIPTSAFEGDSFIQYVNTGKNHDDWLISPTLGVLDPLKVYRLRYRYRVNLYDENRFEVLASNTGIAIKDFTKVIVAPKKNQKPEEEWFEETILLSNMTGSLNIAWHVIAGDGSAIDIDNVRLDEVSGCIPPGNLTVEAIEPTKVTLHWKDEFNTKSSWEYVVQQTGLPAPTTAGTATTADKVTVTTDYLNNPLNINTAYDYYVRVKCADNTYSDWTGPFYFRTSCALLSPDFSETFELTSENLNCWSVIDYDNNIAPLYVNYTNKTNRWRVYHQGFNGMGAQITSYDQITKSSLLVSPTIAFKKGKTYRVRYKIKSDLNTPTTEKLEILASNQGVDKTKFTTIVMPPKAYSNFTTFIEEVHFISNLDGNVNIAWHSLSYDTPPTLRLTVIDDVFIEEVQNCPEPIKLGVTNIQADQVELTWTDDQGGSTWEYWIQPEDGGIPAKNGTLTTNKNTVASKDYKGDSLIHNTSYEYYVRTKCSDGSYSIWAGPFVFTTGCGIYETPFWEGFNKEATSIQCWTTYNAKTGATNWKPHTLDKFEGNQSYISNNLNAFSGDTDDWLISPTVRLDGSDYLLKFNYKALEKQFMGTWLMHEFDNNLEISLSQNGSASVTDFTTILLPNTKIKSEIWQEKAILLKGIKGDVNIAWRVLSKGKTYVNIDHVRIEKVKNCIEPTDLQITPTSPTSFDLSWTQLDSSNQWEVIVVPYKQPVTYTPIQSLVASTTSKISISGLAPGMSYSVYVRAVCSAGIFSTWSSAHDFQTNVNKNDNCDGAITIPVNTDANCIDYASASFTGATKSAIATSNCQTNKGYENDIWFSFTPESTVHTLTISDLFSYTSDFEDFNFEMGITLYATSCGNIDANTPAICLTLNKDTSKFNLNDLLIGTDYLIRIQVRNRTADYRFNICITTPSYVLVSPSGAKYSTEELINDVFINSSCQLASNISYQNGDGSIEAQDYNTFGYFNANNSIFPFKEGIVLSTNEVQFVPGPFRGGNAPRGDNHIRWTGDKDINDAIKDAGGGPKQDKRVTQVEFDFISVKDSIQFEYLFASNSYDEFCSSSCMVGALFAAWLIDTTTGEGQNLAKIRGTDTSISINTIRDAKKANNPTCNSINKNLYWKHYGNNVDDPLEAPIDFVGLTKPMKSETIKIIPGRKYHIKLAVMDFCDVKSHTSVVFFNAASFDLGKIQLGPDWTVDSQTALCAGESRLLQSGLGTSDELKAEIKWYKDGELIEGENKPNLLVTENGLYTIKANFTEINCQSEGEINIEIYPDIKKTVAGPEPIYVCRYALEPVLISLEHSVQKMLVGIDKKYIEQGVYLNVADAERAENPIQNRNDYNLGEKPENRSFYIRIEDTATGCYAVFELKVIPQQGEKPNKPEDVKSCQSYTLPKLAANQTYFTAPDGKGVKHLAGDVLAPGIYTMYILQQNEGACYEQTSFTISITAEPELQHIEDQTLECEFYVLPELLPHNKYFIEQDGQRLEIMPNTTIYNDTTIFIVAESDDQVCYKENSFRIKYNDCPIPRGFSPNGDGINDRFDLSLHNVSSLKIFNRLGMEVYTFKGLYLDQWDGKDKKGKVLPSGTYYYVVVSFNKTRTGWVEINK